MIHSIQYFIHSLQGSRGNKKVKARISLVDIGYKQTKAAKAVKKAQDCEKG